MIDMLSPQQVDFSRIGLGTVQLGMDYGIANTTGQPDDSEARAILDTASTLGINLLDTAMAYGNSQLTIGANTPERFRVVSKWDGDPVGQLKEALHQLRLEQLYGWMAHRSEVVLQHPDFWKAMEEQKAKGRVQKIGFSIYSPTQLERLLEKGMVPDLLQIPCNVLDNRFVPYIGLLAGFGCEVHCRSVFLQGLLFATPASLNPFFQPVRDWLQQVDDAIPDKVHKMSVLIHHVLQLDGVSKIIIGVDNSSQLADLLKALQVLPTAVPSSPEMPEVIINPSLWPKVH